MLGEADAAAIGRAAQAVRPAARSGPGTAERPFTGRTVVIQPLPGIGDMAWHLAHLHALAEQAPSGRITVVAKPSSQAADLLGGEAWVEDIITLRRRPRAGAGREGDGLLRLIGALRRRDFGTGVVLHHSTTLACALQLAAIPNRFGYGFTHQRVCLNRPPFLPETCRPLDPVSKADAYIAALGLPAGEPLPFLRPSASARAEVAGRLAGQGGPYVVLGVGSSEAYKQWGEAQFAQLCDALQGAGWPLVVMLGGAAEAEMIGRLTRRSPVAFPAVGWRLGEVAALIQGAAYYVGNDTATLNLAAMAGSRAYGLFGATTPLRLGPWLRPVYPADGPPRRTDGMERISVAAVLAAIVRDRGGLGH
ncbi:glycosyltransferase family 9 protein [Acidisphaera rubrifaciens]|uniref:Glycosyl transferase n=1 Tax=Acidisphaera rubrifaciens HS-AP3 TaxID=1231350 RepID=A0A0D6P8N5_9PROT|nr:glycosyltransferase family 9 protein [Acidisphaera rubrifaciens]GAN77583.1 glycosyl transferase [Acidisphaera rubrifaciens HS-AP3]